MSTFNDIEMFDENGETYTIDLPKEFAQWNRATVRANPEGAEFFWSDIAESIKELISEKYKVSLDS